jgi:hypothetical protein
MEKLKTANHKVINRIIRKVKCNFDPFPFFRGYDMKKIIVVLSFIFTLSTSVHAEYIKGKILVEYWHTHKKANAGNVNRNADAGFYRGYIISVVDSYNDKLFVIPITLKAGSIYTIVGRWLDNHPREWNKPAVDLVVEALQSAFPMQKK